jgi:antiviral helicase SKI2
MHSVESYKAYQRLLQKMSENKCHGCIKLKEHISLMREQKMYKDQLNELKFQMSDEALQQMPEFQGRVRLLYSFLWLPCCIYEGKQFKRL